MKIEISFNNNTARLHSDDGRAFSLLNKLLAVEVEGSKFSDKYKRGLWDGWKRFFSGSGAFSTGFLDMAMEELEANGYSVELTDKRDKSKLVEVPSFESVASCLSGVTLRDYQAEGVIDILKKTRGIIRYPTGAGKTLTASAAIKQVHQKVRAKCLFLTHKKELLHQTKTVIESRAGIKTAVIGDGLKDLNKPVCVGMVQSLYAALKRKCPVTRSFLENIDMLIVDECHLLDAKSFLSVANECKNALYRIGLSATPLMKSSEADMTLISATGSIIREINIKGLVDRGLLAQPILKFVKISSPTLLKRLNWQEAYHHGIVYNDIRNESVVREALDFAKSGKPCLILVNKIEHGEILIDMLRSTTVRCKYIHGKKNSEVRQLALQEIQNGELDILVSSTILDEGVDVPAISAVILAGGWKSPIKMYQRVGRGMRIKEGSNEVYIVDFIDLTHRYLAAHSMSRYKLAKSEEGFKIVNEF